MKDRRIEAFSRTLLDWQKRTSLRECQKFQVKALVKKVNVHKRLIYRDKSGGLEPGFRKEIKEIKGARVALKKINS